MKYQEDRNFPEDFLWGTATSSHQVEGNNKNNDWWYFENNPKIQKSKLQERSGSACDSYNKYEEDFELCKKLNNNAVRISIEWSRIEPKQGIFDPTEIEHYKKVLQSAKSKGLKTFVTLHHFTNPYWFYKKGGFLKLNSPQIFSKFAVKIAQELDEYIDFYSTINEPQALTAMGYIKGKWPPQRKNLFYAFFVHQNLIKTHILCYKKLKKITQKPIGIVKNISWFERSKESTKKIDKILSKISLYLNSDTFLKPINRYNDYIGLNYYFSNHFKNSKIVSPSQVFSDTGWSIDGKGLLGVLVYASKYKKPIYITENGVADATDRVREFFLQDMLKNVATAIKQGVDVRGYFYWSLLDNFEWASGFWPNFGLVKVERENNFKRVPRNSFYSYAKICKEGII